MTKKIINKMIYYGYNFIFRMIYSKRSNLKLDKSVKVNKLPCIQLDKSATISLMEGVMLNSSNNGYHGNMHSKVKLLADRPDAHIIIGSNTRIHGTCIHAYSRIEIGKNCLIAANCQIFDGNGHDLSLENPSERIFTKGSSKPVFIGNNVWVGMNSIILPGVSIGDGSIIAAGSVVVKSIPENVIAGGNPAKVFREFGSKGSNLIN